MNYYFFKNASNILENGEIENIKIKNIDILESIFRDSDLADKLYNGFIKNYNSEYDNNDMLLTKTNDFMYRLSLLINDFLIPVHKIDETKDIKDALNYLLEKDIDLYSAVSYDPSDMEIIEEFESEFKSIDI